MQQIDQILCIAQIGEVGPGDDKNVVGAYQSSFGPSRPQVRNIENDARNGATQGIKRRVECLGSEVIDPVERGRRGQQAEMVGAFRQQTVDECGIDTIRRENRVGNALRRILIVIEPGGTECQIEIRDNRFEGKIAGDSPCDVMRHGRSADAALGADDRNDASHRLGIRCRKQAANRPHNVDRADRHHQIFADAASRQLAVKRDVVDATDDDHARAGVADFGELIEAGENIIGASIGLDQDNVRRRRTAVGFGCGGNAAHLDFNVRFCQTPILAGGLNCGGGFNRFAKGLDRDSRRRCDMRVVACRFRHPCVLDVELVVRV